MEWVTKRYKSPDIIITENGCAFENELQESAGDKPFNRRINFFQGYLEEVHRTIANGAIVKGYFAWSLMDNFEWTFGYSMRFGLVHINYDTQERTPKPSAYWYRKLMEQNRLTDQVSE